ncbi:MAG: hypothetical protein Q8K29_19675 [Polaromonas sp.]|nr:hypothetical protein [Polaromonas sp.]
MWKKIGFYSLPEGRPKRAHSHAQLPTALVLGNKVRVFFAARNVSQHSSVDFVDLALDGERVSFSTYSEQPVLTPGDIGTFDEHGVFPASIVKHNQKYFMYYIGWNQGAEAPMFYASVGLAVSEDGEHFVKHSVAPIMSRSVHDPCLVTSPHVYIDNGIWRMTYVSGTAWSRKADGTLQSHYHIKCAESQNGIDWRRDGKVAIDYAPGETNIARSWVTKLTDENYKMWFSFVSAKIGKYRIGYAESNDGQSWRRNDAMAGIDADDDQSRDMICYPCVFEFAKARYMVYNGDGFGKNGFGVAVWSE